MAGFIQSGQITVDIVAVTLTAGLILWSAFQVVRRPDGPIVVIGVLTVIRLLILGMPLALLLVVLAGVPKEPMPELGSN